MCEAVPLDELHRQLFVTDWLKIRAELNELRATVASKHVNDFDDWARKTLLYLQGLCETGAPREHANAEDLAGMSERVCAIMVSLSVWTALLQKE